MLTKIILMVARAIDEHTTGITKLITFIVGILTARDWIEANNATGGHAVALAALVFLVVCPILYFIFTCLMLIPKFICHVGLEIYYVFHEEYSRFQERTEYWYEDEDYEKSKSSSQASGGGQDAYAEALKFFGLSNPFSEAELKEKYREAIKKAHPDAGGSTEEAEKVNLYYSQLKGMWV